MKQRHLLQLADERVKDAEILFTNKRWSAAYYLAGYAIECALKAAILAKLSRQKIGNEIVFLEGDSGRKYRDHNLENLSRLAGLSTQLNSVASQNPTLAKNWLIVKNWQVDTRYDRRTTRKKTLDLMSAVSDKKDGVLIWIKNSL
ncbi:HEPN domain-containing protein [Lacunimicrobium album]